MKFHINKATGNVGKCSAVKGQCPFGPDSDHFTSADAARSSYESLQSDSAVLDSARKDLEQFGEKSSVFNLWSKIHSDFKSRTDGKRTVLVNGGTAGTILTPWHGPKILQQLQVEAASADAFQIEPTSNMAGWTMTTSLLDLKKVKSGERYYDKFGSAFEVATVRQGTDSETPKVTMRVLDDNGVPIGELDHAGIIVGANRNSPSEFYKLINLQNEASYIDSVPGHSESKAITDLPLGSTSYRYSAIASLTYVDSEGKPKEIQLITPVGRLTDKKRIELGRQLWAYTGKDPKRYSDVSDREKLAWANQRIMRQNNFTFENNGVLVDYSHDRGGGFKSADNFKLVSLGE